MADLGVHVGNIDTEARGRAKERADALLMPHRALGKLLDIGEKVAGIAGFPTQDLSRKMIVVMAGDHGVTEEGVSAYPSEVTGQMVHGFTVGVAGINVLSRHAGIGVQVVDMGCKADLSALVASGAVIDAKVAPGTANMRRVPAMTREQAVTVHPAGGRHCATSCRRRGAHDRHRGHGHRQYHAVGRDRGGDHGAESLRPDGPGTGVDDAGLAKKTRVIEESIAARAPDARDPIDILAKIGGFEIGGIAGLILGAAESRVPVVIDGVISTAGAVLAWLVDPRVADYMFAAHRSVEPAHQAMLSLLGLSPILDLDMRLGEGTGCALAMPIIEAGVKVIREMATFAEAGVSGG